jgi:hypothetical protein
MVNSDLCNPYILFAAPHPPQSLPRNSSSSRIGGRSHRCTAPEYAFPFQRARIGARAAMKQKRLACEGAHASWQPNRTPPVSRLDPATRNALPCCARQVTHGREASVECPLANLARVRSACAPFALAAGAAVRVALYWHERRGRMRVSGCLLWHNPFILRTLLPANARRASGQMVPVSYVVPLLWAVYTELPDPPSVPDVKDELKVSLL